MAEAMLISASLTSIDLADNQLGADGGRVVAACVGAATARSRLRCIDMRENYLDEGYAVDGHGLLRRTSHDDVEAMLSEASGKRDPALDIIL